MFFVYLCLELFKGDQSLMDEIILKSTEYCTFIKHALTQLETTSGGKKIRDQKLKIKTPDSE